MPSCCYSALGLVNYIFMKISLFTSTQSRELSRPRVYYFDPHLSSESVLGTIDLPSVPSLSRFFQNPWCSFSFLKGGDGDRCNSTHSPGSAIHTGKRHSSVRFLSTRKDPVHRLSGQTQGRFFYFRIRGTAGDQTRQTTVWNKQLGKRRGRT